MTIAEFVLNAIATLRGDLAPKIEAVSAKVDAHVAAEDAHGGQFDALAKRLTDLEAKFVGLEDAAEAPAVAASVEVAAAPAS